MTLTITNIKESDFGNYSCYARNSLGNIMSTVELISKIIIINNCNNSFFK